jgi:hypothetical protein
MLTAEQNLAKGLGNSERAQKCQKAKFFKAARQEWLDALRRFAKIQGLDSLFKIHAGVSVQQELEPWKAFTLALFRISDRPDEVLRNKAAVIHAASSEGDIEFLKKIALALKSQPWRKHRGSLAYAILRYWFAGLLWLMNDKAGWLALCEYTRRKDITKAAYRKACQRLGLKGYKDRMRRPPVLEYDPVRSTYRYDAGWTWLEPHLST